MAFEPHIDNLYSPKGQDILIFKECWALEKVDGTGAKLVLKFDEHTKEPHVQYHSGGASYDAFVKLFDDAKLKEIFKQTALTPDTIIEIYGEAAGGKIQGMSHTYGTSLFFIGYDVCINNKWLSVPDAEKMILSFGLEFVPYIKTTTDIESLDKAKLAPSQLAVRRGIVGDKIMEGVILRPIIELTKNNGSRIISKHKRDEFRETASPRPVVDPSKLKILQDAQAIADEYVTVTRFQHVLSTLPGHNIEKMREIIAAMTADIQREASGEIVWSDAVAKAVGRKTAVDYKKYLTSTIPA